MKKNMNDKYPKRYTVSTNDELKGSKDYKTIRGAINAAIKTANENGKPAYIHDWHIEGSHNSILLSIGPDGEAHNKKHDKWSKVRIKNKSRR